MSFARVPVGSTITRTYFALPEYVTTGDTFPNTREGWDAAVTEARALWAAIVEQIVESRLSREYAEQCADTQVVITLRWKIDYPGGGGMDTEVERLPVRGLRTNDELFGSPAHAAVLDTSPL